MSDNDMAAGRVVAVLLADGRHRIVRGPFRAGRPYQPAVLADPLDNISAVRQVTPTLRRIGDPGRAWAAHSGQRADQGPRLRVHAGHRAVQG
jgi:hypothetical protein